MLLGISSSFAPKDQCGWKPGGICPRPKPSPREVARDEFKRQVEKREEESKAKPKEERTLIDWFNVTKRFIRKSFEMAQPKYNI